MGNQETRRSRSRAWLHARHNLPVVHRAADCRGSPLYLGLAYIDCFMASRSYWSQHLGPCLFHGQANRYSFFRGGGLGGRPRTPHFLPLRGRSLGARNGNRWGMQTSRMLQLDDDMLFEEVDINDDEGQSMEINTAFIDNNSDFSELSEGIVATQERARPTYYGHRASNLSERGNVKSNSGSDGVRQSAHKVKEERLVQIAMNRIRRAQALGESNVRLTKSELDALERKQRQNRDRSRSTAPSGRPVSSSSGTNRRTSAIVEPKSSQRRMMINNTGYDYSGPSIYNRSASQAMAASSGHENQQDAPPGYNESSRAGLYDIPLPSGSRSASSHSPLHTNAPSPLLRPREPEKRYFSVPKGFGASPAAANPPVSRRLPDDPHWVPRARSASSNQSYESRDMSPVAYPPVPFQPTPGRSQTRRSVFDHHETQSSSWGSGIQPTKVITEPSQLSFLPREGRDGLLSMPANAYDQGRDDGFDNYGSELDYDAHPEQDMPRGHYEGFSFRR